MIFNYIYHS